MHKRLSTITAMFLLLLSSPALHAALMYWTDNDGFIRSAELDGTNPQLVFDSSGNPGLRFMEIDHEAGKMYWANLSDGLIARANLDGSTYEVVVSGLIGQYVYGLGLDTVNNQLYWSQAFGAQSGIWKADLNGSGAQRIVNASGVIDLAIDPLGGNVYWATEDSYIRRSNLDGSAIENIVSTSLPHGVALDLINSQVYWADIWGRIFRAQFDGSGQQELWSGGNGIEGLALDVVGGKMYWAEPNATPTGVLRRSNLDGSNMEVLWFGTQPISIALNIPSLASPSAVPEPTTVLLWLVGGVMLVRYGRGGRRASGDLS